MNEFYSKFIMTIVAISLSVIAFKMPLSNTATASFLEIGSKYNPMYVRFAETPTVGIDGPVQVFSPNFLDVRIITKKDIALREKLSEIINAKIYVENIRNNAARICKKIKENGKVRSPKACNDAREIYKKCLGSKCKSYLKYANKICSQKIKIDINAYKKMCAQRTARAEMLYQKYTSSLDRKIASICGGKKNNKCLKSLKEKYMLPH